MLDWLSLSSAWYMHDAICVRPLALAISLSGFGANDTHYSRTSMDEN